MLNFWTWLQAVLLKMIQLKSLGEKISVLSANSDKN